ncbi:hypothetical protein [Sphingomicrobium aestuariivivum]|uniref:hypothetical protein n=1 Tax=Sphingomicrobium aestuariivivum TaxID=1582356 RepID=UPI001FD6C17C|nr:hypothetical protein [Sphingomicrobium aestuariivivum]MCJ8190860.1 hypothetical protein [Sphingomicrobium aestuariivivum]
MARQDHIAPGEALWDWIGAHARDEAMRQLEREGWRPPPCPRERGAKLAWGIGGVIALAMLAGLWWGFVGGRHDGPTRLQEWEAHRAAERSGSGA